MSITISGTGAITGVSTNYSFDKSVSIAGTVTYEDVTSVDSVGIITAQSGIHVTGGNVGIGTDNPITKLNVHSGATNLAAQIVSDDAEVFLAFKDGDSSGNQQVQIGGVGNTCVVYAGGNERLRIDSTGDYLFLGGTLRIKNAANDAQRGAIYGDASSFHINAGVNNLIAYSAGTERVRIDDDGRLLVGLGATDTNANTILQGSSGGTTGAARLFLQRGSAPANGQAMGDIYFADEKSNQGAAIRAVRDGGTWTQGSSHPTRLSIQTTANSASTPTEHISITSAGKIMCGEATPLVSSTANGVEVHCSTTGGALVLRNTNATAGRYWRIGPENNNTLIIYNQGGVGQFMTNGGTSWSANASDLRVKDVVGDLNQTTSWNVLKGLQIKEWWFKNESTEHRSENTPHIGPIAQELHALDPNLRLESPSGTTAATFGQTFDGPVYTYDNDLLLKHALSALNQAITKIETLETQNADLLTRVTALEGN